MYLQHIQFNGTNYIISGHGGSVQDTLSSSCTKSITCTYPTSQKFAYNYGGFAVFTAQGTGVTLSFISENGATLYTTLLTHYSATPSAAYTLQPTAAPGTPAPSPAPTPAPSPSPTLAPNTRLTVKFPYSDKIVFSAFGDWGTGDAEQALIANQVRDRY